MAAMRTVASLHLYPQDLVVYPRTHEPWREMTRVLVAGAISSSVAVRLTGRFELNGDTSRTDFNW